jgi:DNA adenine methylase
MNAIIKWPGGKSREIDMIKDLIPEEYDRYIEPFFGGGALYFHLHPRRAAINDLSAPLMNFYRQVKEQTFELKSLLYGYAESMANLLAVCDENAKAIRAAFDDRQADSITALLGSLLPQICTGMASGLVLNQDQFLELMRKMVTDKFERTYANHHKMPFSDEDLLENLITGFTSGFYMYFRKVYNDIALGRVTVSDAYQAANFYYIREYCYGSMFRYNVKGEFNIPYGGMSYNRKDMKTKLDRIYNGEAETLLGRTVIDSRDFEDFMESLDLTENDFMFLDPPYDTEFSDYEGKAFTKLDQARLAVALKKTKAKFILIIKNTEFIHSLYEQDFTILTFDKQYTYNVRSRNQRGAEHLIITNLPV